MSKDKLNMPGGGLLSVPPADPEPPGLGAVRLKCRVCPGMEQCISCEEIEAYVRADQTAKIVDSLCGRMNGLWHRYSIRSGMHRGIARAADHIVEVFK